MASAYVCIYYREPAPANTPHVLIGIKRHRARWLDFQAGQPADQRFKVPFSNPIQRTPNRTVYDIRNNPGQPVFPGGGIVPPETAQACATRELLEETGITIPPANIINTTIRNFNDAGNVVPNLPADGTGFASVYFKVSPANHQLILNTILQTLAANNIIGDLFPAQAAPRTADDELAYVAFLTVQNARQTFIAAHNNFINTDRHLNALANARLSTDWFTAITNQFINPVAGFPPLP